MSCATCSFGIAAKTGSEGRKGTRSGKVSEPPMSPRYPELNSTYFCGLQGVLSLAETVLANDSQNIQAPTAAE